jgi:hypothetical protein
MFIKKVDCDSSYKYRFIEVNDFGSYKQQDDKELLTFNELKFINNCLKFCIDKIRNLIFHNTFEINTSIINK